MASGGSFSLSLSLLLFVVLATSLASAQTCPSYTACSTCAAVSSCHWCGNTTSGICSSLGTGCGAYPYAIASPLLCPGTMPPYPLEACSAGRSTFYTYTNPPGGSCGYGALVGGPTSPGVLTIAAPNQAFYNNASTCGECYEISGPNGIVIVMIADECPVQGNAQYCSGDIDHFDLSSQAFPYIANPSLGVVMTTKRKVSCPVSGNLKMRVKQQSSNTWISLLMFNHRFGIASVTVQEHGSATVLYPTHQPYNEWELFSPLNIGFVLPLTITVQPNNGGASLTYSLTSIVPDAIVAFSAQFANVLPNYGSALPTACPAPSPGPMFTNGQLTTGPAGWSDYSYNADITYQYTPNTGAPCPSGNPCVLASFTQAYGGYQIGRSLAFPAYLYTFLTFSVRTVSGTSTMTVGWGSGSTPSVAVTTTWQTISLNITGIFGLAPSAMIATVGFQNNQNNQLLFDQISLVASSSSWNVGSQPSNMFPVAEESSGSGSAGGDTPTQPASPTGGKNDATHNVHHQFYLTAVCIVVLAIALSA